MGRSGIGLIVTWILVVSISTVYGQYYSETVSCAPKAEKVTKLHFFFHDTVSGKDPSAVLVARGNITGADNNSSAAFSNVFAVDDPLTVGPELTSSAVIGSAQGLWVATGKDTPSLTVLFDFGFSKGELKGSSISVFSRNTILERGPRELAVVGGRGKFKMAKGFALLNTYFLNATTGDAIVEYHVTVFHY